MPQSLSQILLHLVFSQRTFQEEFVEFLKRYRVEYDERHLWD